MTGPESVEEQDMRARGTAILAMALLVAAGCEPVDPLVRETPVTILKETVGAGRPAAAEDLVTISYRILLEDGRVVLSDRGYRFVLGTGSVIGGIDDGVAGMRVTGEREILVPPQLHWGRIGYGDGAIPPDATLSIALRLDAID